MMCVISKFILVVFNGKETWKYLLIYLGFHGPKLECPIYSLEVVRSLTCRLGVEIVPVSVTVGRLMPLGRHLKSVVFDF